MRVLSVLALLIAAALLSNSSRAEPIRGAGSTFAYPIIMKWREAFMIKQADGSDFVSQDRGVDYEPVGSLGGILRLSQPEIDFAASDAPLPPEELAKFGYVQFPIVMGGIVATVNLDDVKPGDLHLTGALLADI
jgi:phosphate transport system substrate-binding protein